MNDVKCLLLLAKVYSSHKKEDVIDTLNKVIAQRDLGLTSGGNFRGLVGSWRRGNKAWRFFGVSSSKKDFDFTTGLHTSDSLANLPVLWARRAQGSRRRVGLVSGWLLGWTKPARSRLG